MANKEQYLNALLNAKQNAIQTNGVLVNPNNTSTQVGNVEQGTIQQANVNANSQSTWYEKVFGFIDDVAREFGSGFVRGWEGMGDFVLTGVSAIGEAMGQDMTKLNDYIKLDLGGLAGNWTQSYMNFTPWGMIKNFKNYGDSEYWSNMGQDTLANLDMAFGGFGGHNQEDINKIIENNQKYAINNASTLTDMGKGGEFIGGIAGSIGQMLPSIMVGNALGGAMSGGKGIETLAKGAQTIVKGVQLGAFGLGAGGQGSQEALNEGASAGKALAYGAVTGAIEVGTELASDGLGKLGAKIVGSNTKLGQLLGHSKIGGFDLFRKGIGTTSIGELTKNMIEEGIEEVESELLSPLAKSIYKGSDALKDYGTNEYWEGVGLSFASGAVMGGVMEGAQQVAISNALGKNGVQVVRNIEQMDSTQKELIGKFNNAKTDEARQAVLKEADAIDNAKLLKETAELIDGMSEKQKANLIKLYTNQQQAIREFAQENKMSFDGDKIEGKMRKQILDKYYKSESAKNRFVANLETTYKDFGSAIANDMAQKISGVTGIETEIKFSTEGLDGRHAKFEVENGKHIITIDPKYRSQFYNAVAHEGYVHALHSVSKDAFNQLKTYLTQGEGKAIYDKIMNTKGRTTIWGEKLENETLSEAIERVYKKNGSQVVEEEKLAHFMQEVIKSGSQLEKILEGNNGKSVIKRFLQKVASSLDKTGEKKLVNQLQKVIDNISGKNAQTTQKVAKPQLSMASNNLFNELTPKERDLFDTEKKQEINRVLHFDNANTFYEELNKIREREMSGVSVFSNIRLHTLKYKLEDDLFTGTLPTVMTNSHIYTNLNEGTDTSNKHFHAIPNKTFRETLEMLKDPYAIFKFDSKDGDGYYYSIFVPITMDANSEKELKYSLMNVILKPNTILSEDGSTTVNLISSVVPRNRADEYFNKHIASGNLIKINNEVLKKGNVSQNAMLMLTTITSTDNIQKLQQEYKNKNNIGLIENTISSPFGYQGSKKTQLQTLKYFIPRNIEGRFIDVFGGSGVVSLNTNYNTKTTYNELDQYTRGMIEIFKNNDVSQITQRLKEIIKDYSLSSNDYFGFNKLANDFNKDKDPFKHFVLKQISISPQLNNIKEGKFNSRCSLDGKYNFVKEVNSGKFEKIIRRATEKMKSIEISGKDCIEVIDSAKKGDVLYLDPPYILTNAEYNTNWSVEKDRELMNAIDKANERGVKFVLSNSYRYVTKIGQTLIANEWINWAKKYNRYDLNPIKYGKATSYEFAVTNFINIADASVIPNVSKVTISNDNEVGDLLEDTKTRYSEKLSQEKEVSQEKIDKLRERTARIDEVNEKYKMTAENMREYYFYPLNEKGKPIEAKRTSIKVIKTDEAKLKANPNAKALTLIVKDKVITTMSYKDFNEQYLNRKGIKVENPLNRGEDPFVFARQYEYINNQNQQQENKVETKPVETKKTRTVSEEDKKTIIRTLQYDAFKNEWKDFEKVQKDYMGRLLLDVLTKEYNAGSELTAEEIIKNHLTDKVKAQMLKTSQRMVNDKTAKQEKIKKAKEEKKAKLEQKKVEVAKKETTKKVEKPVVEKKVEKKVKAVRDIAYVDPSLRMVLNSFFDEKGKYGKRFAKESEFVKEYFIQKITLDIQKHQAQSEEKGKVDGKAIIQSSVSRYMAKKLFTETMEEAHKLDKNGNAQFRSSINKVQETKKVVEPKQEVNEIFGNLKKEGKVNGEIENHYTNERYLDQNARTSVYGKWDEIKQGRSKEVTSGNRVETSSTREQQLTPNQTTKTQQQTTVVTYKNMKTTREIVEKVKADIESSLGKDYRVAMPKNYDSVVNRAFDIINNENYDVVKEARKILEIFKKANVQEMVGDKEQLLGTFGQLLTPQDELNFVNAISNIIKSSPDTSARSQATRDLEIIINKLKSKADQYRSEKRNIRIIGQEKIYLKKKIVGNPVLSNDYINRNGLLALQLPIHEIRAGNNGGWSAKGVYENFNNLLSFYTQENFEKNFPDLPYNEEIRQQIIKIIDLVGNPVEQGNGKQVNGDLTPEALSEIKKYSYAVRHLINQVAKERAKVYEPQIIQTYNTIKEMKRNNRLIGKGFRMYERAFAPAYTILDDATGGVSALRKTLVTDTQNAINSQILFKGQYSDLINGELKRLGIKPTVFGKTITINEKEISKGQALGLWISLQVKANKQAIDEYGAKYRNKNNSVVDFAGKGQADNLFNELENNLTANEKEFGKFLLNLMNGGLREDYIRWHDETFGKHNGLNILGGEGENAYWMLVRAYDKVTDIEKAIRTPYAMFDNAEHRVKNERPVLLTDALGSVLSYIDNLSSEIYIKPQYRIVKSILNGKVNGQSVIGLLREKLEGEDVEYINRTIEDELGANKGKKASPLDYLMSGYSISMLSLNIGSMAKQFASIYSSNIPLRKSTKAIIERMFNGAEFKKEYRELINGFTYEDESGKKVKFEGIGGLKYRESSAGVVQANTNGVDAFRNIAKYGMWGISKMDLLTVSTGVYSLMVIGKDIHGYEIGSLENKQFVIENWHDFELSQIGQGALSKNAIGRGDYGDLARVVFGFMQGAQRAMLGSQLTLARLWLRNRNVVEIDLTKDYENAKEEFDVIDVEYRVVERELDTLYEVEILTEEQEQRIEELEEEKEQLEKEYSEKKANLIDAENKKRDYERFKISGGKGIPLKIASGVIAQGLMVALISELMRHIKGKKDWDEWDAKEIAMNIALSIGVDWLPLVNTISSLIKGYDISVPSVDLLNKVSTISKSIQNGKVKDGIRELAVAIGNAFGIPSQTIYDYLFGAIKMFDPESAWKFKNIFYNTSEKSARDTLSECAKRGNEKGVKSMISVLMDNYKVEADDEVKQELATLYMDGYNALPSSFITSYKTEGGESVDLTKQELALFKSSYNESKGDIKELLALGSYKSQTSENKAKMVSSLYSTYHSYAKAKVLGQAPQTKLGKMLYYSNGKLNIAKYIAISNYVNTIKANKVKSRKELVVSYINSTRMSKQEKILAMYLCGYSLDDKNKSALISYLTKLGMNSKIVKELLD